MDFVRKLVVMKDCPLRLHDEGRLYAKEDL